MFALVMGEAGKLFVSGPNAVLAPALLTAVSRSASIEIVNGSYRHVQTNTHGGIDAPLSSTPDRGPTGTKLVFDFHVD